MLETLHNYFGFAGSLLVALFVFLFFIFWIAGVAGICSKERPPGRQLIFLSLAIFIPPYPVAWLLADMVKQKRQLKKLETSADFCVLLFQLTLIRRTHGIRVVVALFHQQPGFEHRFWDLFQETGWLGEKVTKAALEQGRIRQVEILFCPGYCHIEKPYLFIQLVGDRKSTRLNSSHVAISYAVFCL